MQDQKSASQQAQKAAMAAESDGAVLSAQGTVQPSSIELDLTEGSIRVHFQPIMHLETHALFGYEALARSASKRFAGPQAMFDNALEAGVGGELGRAVRRLAITHSPLVPLFVNVHAQEMEEGWLARPDEPVLNHPQPVYLEISEAVPKTHFSACQSVLHELRAKGIFLAIDNLGADMCNLKSIAELGPEVVKLDRNLVRELESNKRQFRLVKHLVRLCTEMGARVIATGIETQAELHALQDAGAHYGQGYLLARPTFPPL